MSVPQRQVRACYTENTITVYQAYPASIARPALAHGHFVAPFKRERMTWIKPSFLWMMYRCGWAAKPDQEHVLAVEITRGGFEWALRRACLSHYDADRHESRTAWAGQLRTSPVRVQWDPERSLDLSPLSHRSLQVGLGGEAVGRYVDEWIVGISDVTPTAHAIRKRLRDGDRAGASALLPAERPYPLPEEIATSIDAS
ncbi:DUF4291 domain-containing protein [Plantactinospora sp. S1510]|uniref:DUF4291 domain-containing protein n=1 Tax=Plantactinospora alkalitolerans TaxID=2789879 RepID=A0ABS0GZB5_9ACTN|nr:DUF4291 domain-containing protein [Plantactinospora alkalitolerans]MBF9131288.1 DUF4291 domain-containing protein [Plantactinospora alkalitolerans]